VTVGPPGEVTELLLQWNDGNEEARAALIPLVYRELRRQAGRMLASERRDHTLQPTVLIHEAYQKLVDQRRVQWQNRTHFFAVSAGLMRRILVDHARRRGALRRGGDVEKVRLEEVDVGAAARHEVDVIAVDGALSELATVDPDQARIVELRFFGGLSVLETAEVMGISRATVHRDWAMARAWLHRRLKDDVAAP